jgi:hypothetical protein
MTAKQWILVAGFVWGVVLGALATRADAAESNGPLTAEKIARFRERGPEGLVEALRSYDLAQAEDRQRMFSCAFRPEPERQPTMTAWNIAIDEVGGQRGCAVSRLYWYTNLNEAQAAADKLQRPILSLRMLGKLTDEFSCANSRFFRTALYSNKEISDYLRDNFVLHWQSVRPAPRVTIDFGDGRTLQRTITGNSAHYVLASDGTVLDALPGLYGPQQFLNWLQAAHGLERSYQHIAQARSAPGPRWARLLKLYHAGRRDAILRQWDSDLQQLGERQVRLVASRISYAKEQENKSRQQSPEAPAPPANAAANRAVTKTVVESPLLRFAGVGGTILEKTMDDELWNAVAALHRNDVHLDESSIHVMRNEFPKASVAAALSATKRQVEDPMVRMVSAFEGSMALDEVRNEYLLHRRIHERLAESLTGTLDLDALNEWVYAELFLTPSTDPWLGLAPNGVYSALDAGGLVEPPTQTGDRHGG